MKSGIVSAHSLVSAIELLKVVQDFPKKGVSFIDILPLLGNGPVFATCIDALADQMPPIDRIVGIEARGFIIGGALAKAMGVGFVPARKKGKLPGKTISMDYSSEYGVDTLEINEDAIKKGSKVAVVDDVLATGGTSRAASSLVKILGGEIATLAYFIEIPVLNGRIKLKEYSITSLISYENGRLEPV